MLIYHGYLSVAQMCLPYAMEYCVLLRVSKKFLTNDEKKPLALRFCIVILMLTTDSTLQNFYSSEFLWMYWNR